MSNKVICEFAENIDATRIISMEGSLVELEVLASGAGNINGHAVQVIANHLMRRLQDGTAMTTCRIIATAEGSFDTIALTGSSSGERDDDGSYRLRGSMRAQSTGGVFKDLDGKNMSAKGEITPDGHVNSVYSLPE
ncbi:hypothetical protein V1J52_22005 [Streptomyces sp. TRM 70351]|uniref:hypothetical protein n=1 Tax=Streptomyces sp. TRM 70351 TaxID=3116552 RepID=UPI002E7AD82F|nr:hypothetical protein [Streptomyces sp. TRM 70351]MEE1930824.1 hypothetical protein [Streptomyces sp. TRM 70351]